MRIDMMEFLPLTLQRKESFAIARSSSAISEVVFLAVHSGKRVGHGCAAPTEVTRENVHSVSNTFQSFARSLPGAEFEKPYQLQEQMDKAAGGQPSARAAVEMALFDLAAQAAGVPLYAYLGGRRDRMQTDMTIGIMDADAAVDRARRWVDVGFRALKIKVGRDWKADVKRVKAIRDAVGKDVELRVDGNQGFSWADALTFAQHVRNEGIAFFEQPVSVDNWEGMRALTESSPIPIMADEMVLTPEDVKKLRWSNAARAVNLKLMKHGGILRSMEVNTLCESAGYPTMVGCMGEPQLSIAAGLHFALAQKNVRWLDLDSHFKFAADPTSGLRFDRGNLIAPAKPGLGIDVQFPT
ncbi:MAG TPA: dipeptide epimerase [Thermoplasmata archaeon]|nr:dipeptide epimerase [Thermoplasmata archaeon]